MVLNLGDTYLFNTVSQYLTLKGFKVVFQYQACNEGDTPCLLPSLF